MADDETDTRTQCTPCRGTGALVSKLGGDEHTVTCPWCEGSGSFTPEHDAQEAGERLRGATG